MGAFTILSLFLYIISIYIDKIFAILFTLCRFWQISFGGLLVLIPLKINNKYIANILPAAALITIIITSFYFPGYGFWDLISTVSAGIIIKFGTESLSNKYILSNPLMVFVGKISYSLYIWNWPILMFS
jgi:peptidoglycan/LPS O-acetylase OafA/YrhL